MARTSAVKKNTIDLSSVKEYLPEYDNALDKLNKEIEKLNVDLKDLTSDIEDTEKDLKEKIKNIEETRADAKKKVKSSEELTSDFLTEIASKLEELTTKEEEIEKEAEEKKEDYTRQFSELKDNLTIRNQIKDKLESMKEASNIDFNDIVVKYEKVFEKIEEAISVCDNEKLKEALADEKESMKTLLVSKKDEENYKIENELKPINQDIEEAKEEIKFSIEPEIKEEETISVEPEEEIKTIDISSILDDPIEETETKVEIEVPEPKVEVNTDEDSTFKIDFDLVEREVIQRDPVSESKVEQIRNSNIIEEAINNFFYNFNSGLLTSLNNEGEKLKTIDDDIDNSSLYDKFYIGANIKSNGVVEIYKDINDLRMKFNPNNVIINDSISEIVLLDNNQVINETNNLGTTIYDLKVSSGVKDSIVTVAFKLKNMDVYILLNDKVVLI